MPATRAGVAAAGIYAISVLIILNTHPGVKSPLFFISGKKKDDSTKYDKN